MLDDPRELDWSDDVAVDTETTGLDPYAGARPFSISFTDSNLDDAYIEFKVDWKGRVVYDKRIEWVRECLGRRKGRTIFFNAGFDVTQLRFAGVNVRTAIEDASIALRVARYPRMWWKLKPFSKRYLGIDDHDEKALRSAVTTLKRRRKLLLGSRKVEQTHDEGGYWLIQWAHHIMLEGLKCLKSYQNAAVGGVVRQRLVREAFKAADAMKNLNLEYNVRDTQRTIQVWYLLKGDLQNGREGDWDIYREEMDRIYPLVEDMRRTGIYVNMDRALEARDKAYSQLTRSRREMYQLTWRGFNPNSYNQKAKLFGDDLGLEPLNMTKPSKTYRNGRAQYDDVFMEHYKDDVPAVNAIVEYRKCTKAISTYFDYAVDTCDEDDMLHFDVAQWGTISSRFSGRLLTIPKRAPDGDIMLLVREMFGPRPGRVWVCMDYKQVEARMFAEEAHEPTMLEAFSQGRDVYQEMANKIVDVTGRDVGRNCTKHLFLGKNYGLGVQKAARTVQELSRSGDTDISIGEAKKIVYLYDSVFVEADRFMEKVKRKVEVDGWVENRYGQRVDVPKDKPYMGVNYIIQPSAARLAKRAMYRCAKMLHKIGMGRLVLQIHDELIFELPRNKFLPKIVRRLKELMEEAPEWKLVRMEVDVEVCVDNWLERESWEKFHGRTYRKGGAKGRKGRKGATRGNVGQLRSLSVS